MSDGARGIPEGDIVRIYRKTEISNSFQPLGKSRHHQVEQQDRDYEFGTPTLLSCRRSGSPLGPRIRNVRSVRKAVTKLRHKAKKKLRVSNAKQIRVRTVRSASLHIGRVRKIGRMLLRRSGGFPRLGIGVNTECFHVWGSSPMFHAWLIVVMRRIRSSSSRLRRAAERMPSGPAALRVLTASRARSSSSSEKGDSSASSCGGVSRSLTWGSGGWPG